MDFQDLLIAGHDPERIFPPMSSFMPPPGDMTADQRAIYAQMITLTGEDEKRLTRFITWCNALTLNAYWWECNGFGLLLPRSGASAESHIAMHFSALRKMGLDQIRPDPGAEPTAFHLLDDAAMIALLVRAGRIASRNVLLDALVEAAANGLRVLDAIDAGITPVLKGTDGGKTAVAIPAWA